MRMLEPKPCPAGNCDAELYAVGEFVFCPKCGMKNPNYTRVVQAARSVPTERRTTEFEVDMETGVIKW